MMTKLRCIDSQNHAPLYRHNGRAHVAGFSSSLNEKRTSVARVRHRLLPARSGSCGWPVMRIAEDSKRPVEVIAHDGNSMAAIRV